MQKKSLNFVVAGEEFTSGELAPVDRLIEGYKSKRELLIPVLEDIQEAIGYLPRSIQKSYVMV